MKGGRNQEGYADPTAVIAVGRVIKEQKKQSEYELQETEKRAHNLIKVLEYIIKTAGFELVERIQVKDIKTGKVYR